MKPIFETKEEYLKFKAHWKKFIADGKHKKYKVPYKAYPFNEETRKYECVEGYTWTSDLTVTHHLIYGIATRVKINKMFKSLKYKEVDNRFVYQELIGAMRSIRGLDPVNDKVFGGILTKKQLELVYSYAEYVYDRTNSFQNLEKEDYIFHGELNEYMINLALMMKVNDVGDEAAEGVALNELDHLWYKKLKGYQRRFAEFICKKISTNKIKKEDFIKNVLG